MKTLDISEAPAQLKKYARSARREPLLITSRGKPYATLAGVGPQTDYENLVVTTHPKFVEIMARSEARYRAEGGLTSDEVRRQLGIKPTRNKRRAR